MTAGDGYPGDYSYVKIDTSHDSAGGPAASLRRSSSLSGCARGHALTIPLARYKGHPITKVKVSSTARLILTKRGRTLRSIQVPGLAGARRHRIRVYEYTRHGFARRVTHAMYGCGRSGA